MTTTLSIITSDQDLHACFAVFKELRPQLQEDNFIPQIRRQELHGYRVLVLREDNIVKSVAGFRLCELLVWGKILYIDDLATLETARGRGYADQLMDWLIDHARAQDCKGVHLDTGYTRYSAHRLYLRKKMQLNCHHMALEF